MEVIQVHARPHNLNKFRKGVASHGQSGFIGCQVAGDDVRGARCYCAKISTAAEVRRRIDYRRLAKVWIAAWQELSDRRAGAVALIAGDVGVDDIAAQPDQRAVFPVQIQVDWRYRETLLNPRFAVVVILCSYAGGTARHSRQNDRGTERHHARQLSSHINLRFLVGVAGWGRADTWTRWGSLVGIVKRQGAEFPAFLPVAVECRALP